MRMRQKKWLYTYFSTDNLHYTGTVPFLVAYHCNLKWTGWFCCYRNVYLLPPSKTLTNNTRPKEFLSSVLLGFFSVVYKQH